MNRIVPDNTVMVEVKSVYGQTKVYPVNQAAVLFAEIAGTKTLSHAVLCRAERLGFAIVAMADADWRKAS